jgi:hypothetical protein
VSDTDAPDWLPNLIILEDFNGDWSRYINEVFAIFYKDFIETQPKFRNKWIRCRRDPMHDGKEAGFWHCTSEGLDEANRKPDLRRCERIRWIRAIIENSSDEKVLIWTTRKNYDLRTHLWYDGKFLIVLGNRKKCFQLITTFYTDRKHTIKKLRKEYEMYKND